MSDSATRELLGICDQVLAAEPDERDALVDRLCGGDADLLARVSSVLGAVTQADRAMGDQAIGAQTDWLGKTLGNYHIVEVLGEGGMGAVYRAERAHEDFTQTVALKVIRGRFLADDLIRRFNAERDILARLNHPYIAQLIDGGTEQGIPFLVMEYIDGIPVNDFLDAQSADVATRVRMVQNIALAVHSAHQNLVVHRDLKPGNVLVTDDGIPKLLDFGIAKLVATNDADATADATVMGRQALTPNYASPEQIKFNTVTTLSDVYSLGVLAYELLTGERPYHLDTTSQATLIDGINNVSVPRASQRLTSISDRKLRDAIAASRATTPERLDKTLRGDLDNILAKALALEPEHRYTSIAAFSADLGRYLSGQPVEAHADSLMYRARRFVARNRGVVLFSSALFVSLVVGLAATTWSYVQAERAREDASARFEQVRSLAKSMMFDVYDDIAKVPGTVSVRSELASTAQQYLETLAADARAPVDVQLDAAQGFSRLYTILNREAVDDAGDRARAAAAWDKAHSILLRLSETDADNASVWHALGDLESNRAALMLDVDNDPEASAAMLSTAKTRFEKAVTLAPDDFGIAMSTLTAKLRQSNRLKWSDDYQSAIVVSTDLLSEIGAAKQVWPDNTELLVIEGDTYQLRGESAYWIDDYDTAMPDYGASIAAYQAALNAGGPDQAVEGKLSNAFWSRGNSHIDLQDPQAAAVDFEAATELVRVAAARDPDDTTTARKFAILRASRAMALVNSGESDTAIDLMHQTNDWFETQAAQDTQTPGPQRSLAISYYMMGDIYRIADRKPEACEWFERSLASWLSFDERFGIAEFDAGQPDKIRENITECSR
ncbi:MAG: serine/threonine-protein kinase [Pseudomonadota bacterium]